MNIAELLTDVAASINAIVRSMASKHNLTSSQVFHLLLIPFDGIPMSGLARRLGLDNSTLTRNIRKLETRGVVGRQADGYDKRIKNVVLTNRGVQVVGSLEQHLEIINQNLLEQIDLDTQEHLVTSLETLSWSLDALRENQ